MTAAVSLDAVTRTYGSKVALDEVTASIDAGSVHCLLGPNGAGKTTMLRMIAGLVAPSAGKITVLGGDPYAREIRNQIGWVPSDDRSFYMRVSGRENLLFFARLYGLGKRKSLGLVDEVLAEVGLEDAATKEVSSYSHGMTKRLAVARAFLSPSPLILVDEATHDLDIEGSRLVRRLFRDRANDGATIVWSTHRLEELVGLVDTVTVLDRGSVRFDGSLQELVASVERPVYRVAVRYSNGGTSPEQAAAALGGAGTVVGGDGHDLSIRLATDTELGGALQRLMDAGIEILDCQQESGPVERAVEMKLKS